MNFNEDSSVLSLQHICTVNVIISIKNHLAAFELLKVAPKQKKMQSVQDADVKKHFA